jgi:hypothetical protein
LGILNHKDKNLSSRFIHYPFLKIPCPPTCALQALIY